MIPRSNLHTHSTFCDGKNTPEEMIRQAISLGMVSLGFSGHADLPFPDCDTWCMSEEKLSRYCQEIFVLAEKYKDQIEVVIGIEQDYFSPTSKQPLQYMIGSVHYIKRQGVPLSVDINPEEFCKNLRDYYGGDALALAKDYFTLVADIVKTTNCDIVGHFDLLTKFNEQYHYLDEDSHQYQAIALEALDAVLQSDTLIEINTGAIARGRRSIPYPPPFVCRRIAEKKGRMIINSDAHRATHLLFGFDDAIAYARACGFRELWYYQNGQFHAGLIV